MHKNRSYWRVYWAGAAMALQMDIALHKQNKTLAETVAKLAKSYPDNAHPWTGGEVIQKLDGYCGSDIPSKTMATHIDSKTFPDTAALGRSLGVTLVAGEGRNVSYDDSAPDAAIRKKIIAR